MEPEFSREAARVLSSPYFRSPPPDLEGEALVKWWGDRAAEQDAVEKALGTASTYDDLTGEPKAVYDRAAQAVAQAMAEEDLYDRLHGG